MTENIGTSKFIGLESPEDLAEIDRLVERTRHPFGDIDYYRHQPAEVYPTLDRQQAQEHLGQRAVTSAVNERPRSLVG